MNIANQRIVITGASGGIGQAMAKMFALQGSPLLLVGRDEQKLQNLVEQISGQQARVRILLDSTINDVQYLVCDINQVSEREKLIAKAQEFNATLLVNNAGINQFAPLAQTSASDMEDLIKINLITPMILTQQFLACVSLDQPRTIVNVGSAFGSIGFPFHSNYCASKFGLKGFTEALKRELSTSPDKVFYLAPRATATSMNNQAMMEMNRSLGNQVDQPEIVAQALLKQLSKEKSRCFIGWPEKFFARLNGLLPELVDRALASKTNQIKALLHPNKSEPPLDKHIASKHAVQIKQAS